jgi:hypothetical protein
MEKLYRTRIRLVIPQYVLTLFYILSAIHFSNSRRHIKQVLLDFAAEESGNIITFTDRKGDSFPQQELQNASLQERTGCEGISMSDLLREDSPKERAGNEWNTFLAQPGTVRRIVMSMRDTPFPRLSWLVVQMTPTHFRDRPIYLKWKRTFPASKMPIRPTENKGIGSGRLSHPSGTGSLPPI